MALKRLDEEFNLKPGTQLLPYMQRLLPSLEGRFQSLEKERKTFDMAVEDMRAVALMRINEILIPATENILEVTTLGFLLGPSSSSVKLEIGNKIFVINEGAQRESFTPSPYVIVEREANITDYAIARVEYYDREIGALSLNITAWHGNPGPWTDWVISSTPGMADSTKLYHDAIGPLHDQVVIDAAQVAADKTAVKNAADALFAAGLDAQSFIRKDGAVDFLAVQKGIAPAPGANDTALVTSAWSRARMQEYVNQAMQRTGDTMTGPLYLANVPITQPMQAVHKQYTDNLVNSGHWTNDWLGVRGVSPYLALQSSGTQQNRFIVANSAAGVARWQLFVADSALESGGNAGSNLVFHRYSDTGAYLGAGLSINRSDGLANFPGHLNVGGGLGVVGNLDNSGDFWTYRASNTGVVYMGNQRTSYHYFDGGTHQFTGGGISCGGSPITGGHLNCYSLSTQGYAATVWGITVHGVSTMNNDMTISGQLNITGRNANYLQFYDTDWGPMHIHHNQDLIGFLNNGGGWLAYFTNAGHLWIGQYGWLHDYVNGRANAYAWDAANYRYNQLVNSIRYVHAGDIDFGASWYGFHEIGNASITGLWMATPYYGGPGVYAARWRQTQNNVGGNWYTCGWAS